MDQLRQGFQHLGTDVIAGLLEYKVMCPYDTKCRYVYYENKDKKATPNCKKHKCHMAMICAYCGYWRCGACLNEGTYKDHVCCPTLGNVPSDVCAFLSRRK